MRTRMKEFRDKLGITQEVLAKKVDVTRQTILFLEKGKYNPSLRLAYKISRALNAKVEDIFSFEDESAQENENCELRKHPTLGEHVNTS
jgi:putative transcriptional regulator